MNAKIDVSSGRRRSLMAIYKLKGKATKMKEEVEKARSLTTIKTEERGCVRLDRTAGSLPLV